MCGFTCLFIHISVHNSVSVYVSLAQCVSDSGIRVRTDDHVPCRWQWAVTERDGAKQPLIISTVTLGQMDTITLSHRRGQTGSDISCAFSLSLPSLSLSLSHICLSLISVSRSLSHICLSLSHICNSLSHLSLICLSFSLLLPLSVRSLLKLQPRY